MSEKQILVRATLSADGRSVRVALGVEVPASAVMVTADLPPDPEVMVAVFGFASDKQRSAFEEELGAWLST